MKQIRVMKWLLEVDVIKTKEFYSKEIELCDCLYCENYREASKHLDSVIMEIYYTLGIDSIRPSHISEFGEIEDGLRLYIGSYHIVGKLVEGESCTTSTWNDDNTAEIKNFKFGFEKDLMFVHHDFPHPVLQLGFEAKIPWVLNEEPEE